MKRILSAFVVFCMMTAFTTSCNAEPQTTNEDPVISLQIGNPMMTVNREQREIDPGRGTVPMIENNRTLLPIRAIVETMGGAVVWDEETRTTVLAKGDHVALLTIGSKIAFLDETSATLDTVPIIHNDRTMLPIRFIAESFGYEVSWDGETQIVTLTPHEAVQEKSNVANQSSNTDLSANVYAADNIGLTVENNIVTVTNAPDNSTLIMAFFKNNALSGVKLYKGRDTITADISQNMASADLAKIFLWDMESLQPLSEKIEAAMTNKIEIEVNGHTLTATLEDNSSAQALLELLNEGPITIEMQDYGNFEKVGSLGTTLPRNDEQITTQAGDLILYQGNQLTIYYDTNSWNFTRLGKIDNITQRELKEILGTGSVTATLSLYSAPQENNPGNFDFETKSVMLNSGYKMPIAGLGTYSLSNEECYNSVTTLLQSGGRLIDTAYMYHNEESVGRAIRDSGVPREEIFVITKLYPSQFAEAENAIDEALGKLDIGYIDMMLLHHPGTGDVEAYHAMERAVADGKIHSIGVSNYYIEEMTEFLPQVNIKPALVQNEIHPYYQESEVIDYMHEQGITVQGWYPFGGRGHTAEMLGDETINEIAQAHGVTAAQVILRWNLQKGVVVIPGSSNPDHIRENLDIFGFELTDEEMERMNALNRDEKHDWY